MATDFLYFFPLRLPAHAYTEVSEARCGEIMLNNKPNVNRTDGPRPQTKRFERARQIMRLRHDSICTERSYTHCMRRYIPFHYKRHSQDRAGCDRGVPDASYRAINLPSGSPGVFIYHEGLLDIFNEGLSTLGNPILQGIEPDRRNR